MGKTSARSACAPSLRSSSRCGSQSTAPARSASTTGPRKAAQTSAQRLPVSVSPSHYDLAFVVDLAHERFEGTETIRVQLAEPTAKVVLNAAEIQFREVTIGAGATAQTAAVTLDEPNQTATFTVPVSLSLPSVTV